MKYLYELTLNQSESIMARVTELCEKDANVNDSCVSREIKYNTIQLLFELTFDTLRNLSSYSIEYAIDPTVKMSVGDINSYHLRSLASKGTNIKLLITVLKHFRNSINEIIIGTLEDKNSAYKHLDANTKCFDLLELALYRYWEGIDLIGIYKIEELQLQARESKKLLNEAIEHVKTRSEFFSDLSHDLRTPLNVILGTLQLVDMYSSKSPDPVMDKIKKYHKIMRQNCYRLLRLVNNLIDINKLDAGYMYLKMDNHDIISIISNIAASVADYIENKGIEFKYSTKTDSKVIACDPDKLERIILNLLSNSIKFTDQGGKIAVNVWDEEDKVFISVRDSGIGIPREKQDLIFGRFVQIEKSLSRNQYGSGIGLSLVKSLVELHGGKISLFSDSGKGCEFIIELPIRQLAVNETPNKAAEYKNNSKIEVINIEFSDIYS